MLGAVPAGLFFASLPGLQMAAVSTYPLRVVFESAVCTELIFSSARAADARLTTPIAARPTVHLLNFIWFLRCCLLMFFRLVPLHFRVKDGLPRHRMVQLALKIEKTGPIDNIFFGESPVHIIFRMSNLHF